MSNCNIVASKEKMIREFHPTNLGDKVRLKAEAINMLLKWDGYIEALEDCGSDVTELKKMLQKEAESHGYTSIK